MAQYANDIFTTEPEAISRSMDMGLDGVVHVSDYNGQAVYMPAESHEAYLAYYAPETKEDVSVDRIEALRAIVQEILKVDFAKAEYQGEKVTLNKPRRIKGGNKKFEVFVQDGDKVKRVTFGDPNMEIRRMTLRLGQTFAPDILATLRKIRQRLATGHVVCGKQIHRWVK